MSHYSLRYLVIACLLAQIFLPQNLWAEETSTVKMTDQGLIDSKAYSAFLVGQSAASASDLNLAVSSYRQLLAIEPNDNLLRDRAFLLSLLNGDIEGAKKLNLGKNAQSATTKNLSLLLSTAIELKESPKAAMRGLNSMLALDPDLPIARLCLPLVLAIRGDSKKAMDLEAMGLAELDRESPVVSFFIRLNIAKIAERRGEEKYISLAKTLYEELYSLNSAAMGLVGMDYAAFLERQGDQVGALKIYDALAGMGNEGAKSRSISVKASNLPPPLKSFNSMISESFMVAAQLASRDQEKEMALIYAHLSQWIDPTPDQRLFFLADTLNYLKQSDKALLMLASLPKDNSRYIDSLLLRRQIMLDQEVNLQAKFDSHQLLDEALKIAPYSAPVVYEQSVLLLQDDKIKQGTEYLESYLKNTGPDTLGWQGHYLLASFYEKQNKWDKASQSIAEALKIAPNQPVVLNFYGYGLINRNLEVKRGLEMVETALQIMPQNGAIMDSKAWGHYRLGEHDKALEAIELAITLEPVDPEITEHLGDIYLALGRSDEAGWAYERALGYSEGNKVQMGIIETKLKNLNDKKLGKIRNKPTTKELGLAVRHQ